MEEHGRYCLDSWEKPRITWRSANDSSESCGLMLHRIWSANSVAQSFWMNSRNSIIRIRPWSSGWERMELSGWTPFERLHTNHKREAPWASSAFPQFSKRVCSLHSNQAEEASEGVTRIMSSKFRKIEQTFPTKKYLDRSLVAFFAAVSYRKDRNTQFRRELACWLNRSLTAACCSADIASSIPGREFQLVNTLTHSAKIILPLYRYMHQNDHKAVQTHFVVALL